MLDDLEAAWNVIEGFGHIGADLAQDAAASRTGACSRMDNLLALQMFCWRAPYWLGVLLGSSRDHLGDRRDRRDALSVVFFQCLDGQFELRNRALNPLRGLTELGAPEASKLESKLLDLGARRYRVPRHLADDALERTDIIRQGGRIDRHSCLMAAMPRQPST
jgi:hypothetical protein